MTWRNRQKKKLNYNMIDRHRNFKRESESAWVEINPENESHRGYQVSEMGDGSYLESENGQNDGKWKRKSQL